MQRVMMAVESNKVPSQSKAIKSKRMERVSDMWRQTYICKAWNHLQAGAKPLNAEYSAALLLQN
jgi:hypothetical protein